MSSMLLNPIILYVPRSTAPKRLDTFTIGSPSVFHTAPPQPASKARITCSPVFAGGAEASQKGLGLLMPAMSMLRSAIFGREIHRKIGKVRKDLLIFLIFLFHSLVLHRAMR